MEPDVNTEVTCYRCKLSKPVENFSRTKLSGQRNRHAPYCKACMKEYSSKWWKDNVDKSNNYYHRKKECAETRLKLLLRANPKKNDRKALDFEWAWNKLEAADFKCAITKQEFCWESRSPFGLSIDRIDSSIGYTKDNVRFVCWWINAAMGSWGLDKLQEMIAIWQKNETQALEQD